MTSLEDNLKTLYNEFLSHSFAGRIFDKETGLDKEEKLRFGGYPYVGNNYASSPLRILFVGLDIGKDELWIEKNKNTYHDFDSRRKQISFTARGQSSFLDVADPWHKKDHPFNPHMSGTYALTLALLKDYFKWQDTWDILSKDTSTICKTAIRNKQKELPVDVLDFISLVNIHKFVDFDREKRTGDANRNWLDKEFELQFLMKEIALFAPDIIVFQGCAHKLTKDQRQCLKDNGAIIISGKHPSSWRKNKDGIAFNSVGYAKLLSEDALRKLASL